MAFKYNDNGYCGEVLKIDNTLTASGRATNNDMKNQIGSIIDEMGKLSAVAQELKSPITSALKLVNSDHIIYMMIINNGSGNFTIDGFLKMGWKKLYVCDKIGSRSEAMVYCLLDFYIIESKQRKGYGKHLIDHMLQDIGLDASHLAIDKPTNKLLQFMWKNFHLSKLVNQGNNFVIYEEFFNGQSDGKNNDDGENRASAHLHQPMFGRHGAHKHHDTMGEIVQGEGDAASVKFKYNHDTDFVNNQFNEVNPQLQHASGSTLQTNKDGQPEKLDLKFHHNALW